MPSYGGSYTKLFSLEYPSREFERVVKVPVEPPLPEEVVDLGPVAKVPRLPRSRREAEAGARAPTAGHGAELATCTKKNDRGFFFFFAKK